MITVAETRNWHDFVPIALARFHLTCGQENLLVMIQDGSSALNSVYYD